MMRKEEKDFNSKAIEFYKAFYGEKRFYEKNGKYYFVHGNNEITVSGDVSFNLKLKNGNRFTLFGSIVKDEWKKIEIDRFEKNLSAIRYSPMNISIMPQTGALNNIKQAIGNDRFDTFVWLLKQYYNGLEMLIINAGEKNMYIANRKILKDFLDSYGNVYDYCKDIYGIEKEFVDKLIDSGKKTIFEKSDYYEYVNLALDFWEKRMKQENIKEYIQKNKGYTMAMEKISKYIKELK